MSGRRRSQSRVVRELPPELLTIINDLLVKEGATYEEISNFLKEQGHNISRSSVGRYGKKFAERMERLRIVREMAETVVETNKDQTPMALAEAGNQIAIQLLLEALMKIDNLNVDEPIELIKALGVMERTGTMRERLKLAARKKADEAVKNIEEKLGKSMSPEDLEIIKKDIYGIMD